MTVEQNDTTNSETDQRTITLPIELIRRLAAHLDLYEDMCIAHHSHDDEAAAREIKSELFEALLDRAADQEAV